MAKGSDAPALRLELDLPAELAPRLLRLPALASRRPAGTPGRSRSQPWGLTWYDTAEGALAAEGLTVEQPRRGPRLLLRTLPVSAAPWHPGLPPETVAALAEGEAPPGIEGPLVAYAAFDGRRTTLALEGGVELVLLAGRLRAVADEAPVARLTLSGPHGAVLAAARALAEAAPCLPPRAALPELGRALAHGAKLRARRLGAPLLDPDMTVEGALVGLVGHLAEVLVWFAPVAADGTDPAGVHQMRVAIRRLRSALRAFRPAADGDALRAFDAGARDLAAVLGPARDWDVFLAGLGAEIVGALPDDKRIEALLRAGQQRRDAAYKALRALLAGPQFRLLLWDAVALAALRPWDAAEDEAAEDRRARPLPDFAAHVLDKRWRRLAAAGPEIGHLPDAEFHALRLEGKRVRYVAELFAPLWPKKRGRRFLARLAEVQEAFGLANDAAVARALVASLGRSDAGSGASGVTRGVTPWAMGVAEGWALARARRARSRASEAWEDLLSGEAFWSQG
jgi:CHAD domain-containing protein